MQRDSNPRPEIRLSLSRLARKRLGHLAARLKIEAQLADVFGAVQWREDWRSGLTFGDVLVSAASLFDAMAASGYMLPGPAVAKTPMRPAGYLPAWVPFAEALYHVQTTAECTRRNATDALVLALRDRRIASRDSDTGEKIDARDWFWVIFVGAEPLLGAGRNGEIQRVELRREDIEKLWPDPAVALDCAAPSDLMDVLNLPLGDVYCRIELAASAPSEKEPLRPALESEIHRAIGDAYDAGQMPVKRRRTSKRSPLLSRQS